MTAKNSIFPPFIYLFFFLFYFLCGSFVEYLQRRYRENLNRIPIKIYGYVTFVFYMYFLLCFVTGSMWKQIVFSRNISQRWDCGVVHLMERGSRLGIGLHWIGKGVALRWMSIAKTRKSDGPEESHYSLFLAFSFYITWSYTERIDLRDSTQYSWRFHFTHYSYIDN